MKKVSFNAFLKNSADVVNEREISGWFYFAGWEIHYHFYKSKDWTGKKVETFYCTEPSLLGLARAAWKYVAEQGYSGKRQEDVWHDLLHLMTQDISTKEVKIPHSYDVRYKPVGIKTAREKLLNDEYKIVDKTSEYLADDIYASALFPIG